MDLTVRQRSSWNNNNFKIKLLNTYGKMRNTIPFPIVFVAMPINSTERNDIFYAATLYNDSEICILSYSIYHKNSLQLS